MGGAGEPCAEADRDNHEEALEALVSKAVEAGRHIARLAYAEGIPAAAAAAAAYGALTRSLPGLEELLGDSEADVRLAALQSLPQIGKRMHELDHSMAAADIPRAILPLLPPLALDDSDDVTRAAVLAFQQLVALLPREAAAAAALAAIHKLEAAGSEDAAVAAARIFAHTAASWSEAALTERSPELLRRWCSNRNFTVREATACCISLVGEALPLGVWQSALLPWYSQLVRDNNWRVRRAAALDLPRLAGSLHRHQQRVLQRADSACSCSTAGRESCGACSSNGGGSLVRCRTSGVAVEPLGSQKTGTCAHLGSSSSCAGYGARPGDARRRHQTLASSSVWSAHVLRPPAPAAGSGSAASMGKHPLSSSLLVDEPPACSSPSSSSLSSSDERPLPGSLDGSTSPCSPLADGASDGEGACDSNGGDTKQQSDSGKHPVLAAAAASSEAVAMPGAAGTPKAAPACDLAEQQPVLHACWEALRECLDCVTADSSHWVKVTALSGLGPCLLALPPCQVSGLLNSRFAAMGSSTTVIYEISVALACAQSFGLVASRLGARHWGDLRPAFTHLQASRDPAVLQELVDSLPVMAQHLGRDILCVDLLPSLVTIVHNHLAWVDAAFVRAVAPLLEALPQSSHEPLLRVLSKLVGSGAEAERCRTWRLRRGIASQLGRLARASPRATIVDVLWPAAMALCSDPVAAVRAAAAAEVGPLLAALLPLLDEASAADSSEGTEQTRRAAAGPHGRGAHGSDGSEARRKQRNHGSDADASSSGSDSDTSTDTSRRPAIAGGRSASDGALPAFASALCSPRDGSISSSAPNMGANLGRELGGDECEEGGLPCALATPPGGCLGAEERGGCSDDDAPVTGALDLGSNGGGHSSSDEAGGGTGSGSMSDASSSGRSRDGASSSDSEGESASRYSTPPLSRTPVHPAMMHPGMMHPAMMHPAMAPVGSWSAARPKPSPKRSTSASVLPVSRRPPPVSEAAARRRGGSAARLSLDRSESAPAMPSLSPSGLDPLNVGPGLYVDALVDRFARSPSFQGRQLYVAMSLGLLAHAAPLLSARKRALVADALEALAADRVSSVRVVAQGAAAALQAAAAERNGQGVAADAGAGADTQQQKQQQQQQQQPEVQQEQPQQPSAATSAKEQKTEGGGAQDGTATAPPAPAACVVTVQQQQLATNVLPLDATLLGGQQQLLAAARALVRNPGSFEAASAALRACSGIGSGNAAAVAIAINQ